MKKIAMITGATAGIGEATARKLAQIGYNIILTGRRYERLHKLEAEIKKEFKVRCLSLAFDIRELEAVKKAYQKIPADWKNIDLLVNNAGLAAGMSDIHEGDLDDWERMIDTNIKGLLYISRLIMPEMVTRRDGHIINIGSVAGKEVYPKGNVYCATKHAVDALTKAMRIDMLPHGIKVGSVSPGMVETEFSVVRFHGDKSKADAVYDGLQPLIAEDIADAVAFMVTRPKHVNINDILIMPTAQASTSTTYRKS